MAGAAPDDIQSTAHEEQLIAAARQKAAELQAAPVHQHLPIDAVPGFAITGEIGRGGMGVVYRALQLSTNRIVALKVMLAGWFASTTARRRFRREVELTARFQHSGIVRILESGETSSGQPYYAMDYVEGLPLNQWVVRSRPGCRATLELFIAVCEAVTHAHAHGVVHRDLKPENVLIDSASQPHILDFGLSKALNLQESDDPGGATLSMTGQVVGTLRYLSPEQASGQPADVDERTDVFSLGVMLFEALTGQLPFSAAGGPSQFLRRVCEEPPAPPSKLSNRVNHELEIVLLKTLEKEQTSRYASVKELADDLRRFLRGDPIRARPPSYIYVWRKKIAKQRPRIRLTLVVLVLAVLGTGGGMWLRGQARERQRVLALAAARDAVLSNQVNWKHPIRIVSWGPRGFCWISSPTLWKRSSDGHRR